MYHDMNNLTNAASQQNLSSIRTGQMKIIKPEDMFVSKFELILKPVFEKMMVLNKGIQSVQQARNRLFPKL